MHSLYNFFIILYPAGVAGELLTIYAALPYVKKTGMFSLRLPNKYNVSFDYYYFLIIVMFSYVPWQLTEDHSYQFIENALDTLKMGF
ncbi:very-long-chain -3-hydroxyacyl- dehydratase 1 isoform x2 [Limosa lapponica baueri]|uniref:Very-long-chain (3R)-3-hydroxyacyl-CoA dehydratase n=1 Tax=Limosa lapponica baueri TaxID=1758121 RepID=A0A2I0TBN8_LIMLA|nr:very-long-chain -3-hydroxyacyl- dehydratase 1 isoform x2 [Limosa lapponica baueri]